MTETLTWIDAAGTETSLAESPIEWHAPVFGRGMPPLDIIDRANRAGSGRILELIRDDARAVEVPIFIEDDDVRARLRDLAAAFADEQIDGRLVSTRDGQSRQLECRYVGGLEWVEELPDLQKATLRFTAWRPYWEDVTPTTSTFNLGDLGEWLPWEMGTSPIRTVPDNIFAEAEIDNTGNVQAWPVWTLDGPFTSVVLRDDKRSQVLVVDWTATVGRQLVIDTRPGRKTVRDQDGVSRFDLLDDVNDTFFPFPRGLTVVGIELAGATLDSQVVLEWRRRWKTA